jgi:hypothetical protein
MSSKAAKVLKVQSVEHDTISSVKGKVFGEADASGNVHFWAAGVTRLSWRVLRSSASMRRGARASETEGRSRPTEVRVHQGASDGVPDRGDVPA